MLTLLVALMTLSLLLYRDSPKVILISAPFFLSGVIFYLLSYFDSPSWLVKEMTFREQVHVINLRILEAANRRKLLTQIITQTDALKELQLIIEFELITNSMMKKLLEAKTRFRQLFLDANSRKKRQITLGHSSLFIFSVSFVVTFLFEKFVPFFLEDIKGLIIYFLLLFLIWIFFSFRPRKSAQFDFRW
jgi:hypothetical protein